MPSFLQQVSYSREGLQALIKNPQNRIDHVRSVIEKLGGKIQTAWFSFGEYDVVAIAELPDNVSAAALSMAFAAGGSCNKVHTTPLLSPAEAMEAMKKAGATGYRPASASASA